MSENGGSSSRCRRGQPVQKILPMGPRPKNAATVGALEKLTILLCDKGRDQRNSLIVSERREHNVAVRTSIPSLVVRLELDFEVLAELAQLAIEIIAHDQGVTTTEDLALCQAPVAREQPSILTERSFDQDIVRNDLFIGRVVAENAEPARKATEHRVGHEAYGGMTGLVRQIH